MYMILRVARPVTQVWRLSPFGSLGMRISLGKLRKGGHRHVRE